MGCNNCKHKTKEDHVTEKGSLCQLFAFTPPPFILHYILSMLCVLSTKNIAQKILSSIAHCVKTAIQVTQWDVSCSVEVYSNWLCH